MEREETFTTPAESEIIQLQTESEPQVDLPEAVVQVVDPTKLNYEVQQGYRIFRELLSDPYRTITYPFLEPVDAESMGLWDYHERIKKPMCFTTIGSKFNNYEYKSITEVISDMRLILENCYRYNGADHWVSKQGQKVEKVLEQKCALLNRSLREKVTLSATMAVRGTFCIEPLAESSSGRRRSGRNSFLSSLKGENTSLVTQMKIQEECEERERRKQREKEKKEANEALLQELTEWEESQLTAETIQHLHSMWEIPSVGSMLYLMKEILNLEDISFSEFELSFIYPNKSSLLARIFTALLLTPHQRKSLNNKPAMKFKVWQEKLRRRLTLWHKHLEKDGADYAAQQFGLDTRYFEILGEKNPLEENSYNSLTLHKRVWILKSLVDSCLYLDADFRGQLNTMTAVDQRELLLGFDAENWSYLYFPMLCSTDIRIYRQCPLPAPSFRKRKKIVTASSKSESTVKPAAVAPPTPRHPRLRKLRNDPSLSESEPPSPKSSCEEDIKQNYNCSVEEGFGAACYDVDTLKQLCDKFAEPPPPPKRRGRKPKPPPPRKRCEVDLHQTFEAMYEELEKFESKFTKFRTKAKIKLMKESQEIDVQEETAVEVKAEEREDDYGSEESTDENSDSEEEETSDEESESVDKSTADDIVKPLAWKHKLGVAIAEAGGSPGSPAVSEDGVEPLTKKVKKLQKNAPPETEDTANVTVSVSAAEAVQALVNFPSPSSNALPSIATSSCEAVGNLSADTVEKSKAEGVTMALRTKARTTPKRTLVVPTISTQKSSSMNNTSNSLPHPTAGTSTCSSYSGVGADLNVSQVKIPAVLLQHGIVKMKPPKPKVQPVSVEPHITTTSESGQHMEDQMTTSRQPTAIPSSNMVPATVVISPAVTSAAQSSAVVKKTVLVFSQPMDIETTGQLTSKSSTATPAAPPRSFITQGKALNPAMFDTGQSTALKQILTPTRTSSVKVGVPLTPPVRQKISVLPSSPATHVPLLSKPTTASKLLQKTSVVPVGAQKRTLVKKVPATADQRTTQLVENPQSVVISPSLVTTATLAAKPSIVSLGGTTLSSKLVVTPTAISASRPPTTAVGFLSSGTTTAPASVPVVHRKQPMASAGRLQPQHTSRVIGGPTVNTIITSQSVSKSGNIMPTPAVKVLLSVPTSAQTQTAEAKYLPATLQAVQHLRVPKVDASNVSGGVSSTIPGVSSTAATSTIRLLAQPANSQSVHPIGQVSSIARTVVSRPITTSSPSAKASKGSAPHTSATMPLAFVATTTIAQLLQNTLTPSPAKVISVPSALLAKLPRQPTVQKVAGISNLPVHSPVVVKQLKEVVTPVTTTTTQLVAAHSKQYALPAKAGKVVTTSIATAHSRPDTLQKATIPTLPVHSPVVVKQLKEVVTPVTTTTTQLVAAHSKQYALPATAGKVVTTSIATAHSKPDTLQKATIPTISKAGAPSNQHPASTNCVTTVMSSPVMLTTHCKQAQLQASIATTSPVPGTHTKQHTTNTNAKPSPIGIINSKVLAPTASAAVSPPTGAQCRQHAESVTAVTTIPVSSRASEASPPNIHGVLSEGRVPTEQRIESTTILEAVSVKTPAAEQSTVSAKNQPEGKTVRGCTKSSVNINSNPADHSPSPLLATRQTANVKPADSNRTTQDKTNGCSNTASMKSELDSSVLVGGSSILKRSANCINGDLSHIPRKKCKGDDNTPNGTFSNVRAEEKCTGSSTELEHSASKDNFISTSGNSMSKETSPSKPRNVEAETNTLDICNGVVTAQCENHEDAEMDQLKSPENCLKTFCNGLTVERTGKGSTNH